MGSLPKIILMLVCLAFSGFFSASETAFTSFNHTKMKNLAAEGNKRAARVMKMSEDYNKLLSTILVGNNIVNITLSSVATVWFLDLLINTKAENYASAIATAVATITVLIFGEISPKTLAKDHADRFAMTVSAPLRFLITILTPVNWIFMLWKKLLTKIFKPAEEEAVTEGELLTLVDEAHEDGSIDQYDKEMIENIFDFDDISAGEIATHRTDITMLAQNASLEEWDQIINNSRFSRYPVYGETLDDIVGILDARAYFRLEEKSMEHVFENAIDPAYFVPETVKADVLFRNMKKNKESLAIVLDEYGGLQGLVTFTDLVECLVGEFEAETDENDVEIKAIEQLNETDWQINGSVLVSEVEDALGIEIADCDSDTFGGFVLGLYGSIPEDGSTFELSTEQMEIQILDIQDHRIERALITVKQSEEETEEGKDEKAEAVQA